MENNNFLKEILTEVKEIKHDTKLSAIVVQANDRIFNELSKLRKDIEEIREWKAETRGVSNTIKFIWGTIASMFIMLSVGMFNMYVEYKNLDYKIEQVVKRVLNETLTKNL